MLIEQDIERIEGPAQRMGLEYYDVAQRDLDGQLQAFVGRSAGRVSDKTPSHEWSYTRPFATYPIRPLRTVGYAYISVAANSELEDPISKCQIFEKHFTKIFSSDEIVESMSSAPR